MRYYYSARIKSYGYFSSYHKFCFLRLYNRVIRMKGFKIPEKSTLKNVSDIHANIICVDHVIVNVPFPHAIHVAIFGVTLFLQDKKKARDG